MFLETAVHVERLTVLTDEISAEGLALAEMYSNVTVMKFPRERYLVESRSWLYSYVQSTQEPTVVHSTFGHLVKFFEMSPQRFNNNLRLVHTQYTANHDWFNHVRYHDYPMSFHYLGQRLKSYWRDRRMAKSADAIFVLCPGHVDGVASSHSVAPRKIKAVSSEVDYEFFRSHREHRPRERKLVYAGAYQKNKGLDVLFAVLPEILRKHSDVSVEFYGRTVPRHEPWFRKCIAELNYPDRVSVHASLDKQNLRERLQGADLFISASRFEGSPRAVKEAICAGCPVILSSIPGHIGLDTERKYIHFVDGHEAPSWSRVLLAAIEQSDVEWLQRSHKGVEVMAAHYTPEKVAEQLVSEYRDLFTCQETKADRSP